MKYKQGDFFILPLSNGNNALCKVIFTPKGRLKQVIGFTVYNIFVGDFTENKDDYSSIDLMPIDFKILNRNQKIIFTGNQKLKDGSWLIVGNQSLSGLEKDLLIFQHAGHLYENENYIKNLDISEYNNYVSMAVCGFDLVDKIIINGSN